MRICRVVFLKKKNQHLPAAFNTYGGWGEEVLDKLAEPFFNRLRAEERAGTGVTEWRPWRRQAVRTRLPHTTLTIDVVSISAAR